MLIEYLIFYKYAIYILDVFDIKIQKVNVFHIIHIPYSFPNINEDPLSL